MHGHDIEETMFGENELCRHEWQDVRTYLGHTARDGMKLRDWSHTYTYTFKLEVDVYVQKLSLLAS